MNDLIKHTEQNIEAEELVMNVVIKSIRAIYPAWRTAIKSQAELDNMKKEWLIGFMENRIRTDIQIERGLKAARKDPNPFLPSIGQFITWCKAPDRSHIEFDTKALGHDRTMLSKEEVKVLLKLNAERLK